jgi:sn1-specific diacylglycerol lipase
MPAIRLFGRHWLLSSDDLPLPMAGLMTVHTLWCVIILVVYERAHRTLRQNCAGGEHAMAWFYATFSCYFVALCVEAILLHLSLRGRILEPEKRRLVPYFLYAHLFLLSVDIAFTILGTVVDAELSACMDRARVRGMVLSIIIGNFIVIGVHFCGIMLMFSMFGHLPSDQKWYKIFNIIATVLCIRRRERTEDPEVDRQLAEQGTLGHVANCFAEVFQGADVVPSDIAAGMGLLAIQHRHMIENEPLGKPLATDSDALAPYKSLNAMYEDAAHYSRWALAAYGWALFAWADPRSGIGMACSSEACMSCCGCRKCLRKSQDHRDPHDLNREALKKCAGIASDDLFYVSMANGIGEPPYFIARDVRRKAVVLSVRGTLSIADCVTDSMYKPCMLNADAIHEPGLQGSDLHVHSGVFRATNFILSDLNANRILEQTILGEQPSAESAPLPSSAVDCRDWDLVLTGHSLGAGVAAALSLHLRKKFPNLKVWCIEPPGGVLSPKLSNITKAWTYSTVHHCDLFCRLSGPVLLKLRSDMMDSLTNAKLNKFSLMMRMTFNGTKLQISDVLDPESAASESTALREDFRTFSRAQVDSTPMMAAPLHPPGQLIHLLRLPNGSYAPRLVEAHELMDRGMMIQYGFFADHFPDKVAAVLSDLAAGSTEASQSITSMGTSTADSTRTLVDRLVNRQTSQSSRRVLGDLENV